jgi:hypothetical protein
MPRDGVSDEEDVTMDGDARNGKVFYSDEDEDAGAMPVFDPAAVLRAIAAEDETDEDAAPPAFDPASILRAIETEDDPEELEVEPPAPDGESALRAVRAVAAVFAMSREDAEAAHDDAELHEDPGLSVVAPRADAFAHGMDDDQVEDEGHLTAHLDDVDEAVQPAWDASVAPAAAVACEDEDDAMEAYPSDYAAAGHDAAGDAEDSARDSHAVDEEDDIGDEDGYPGDDDAGAALVAVPHLPRMDELDLPGRKPRIALMGEFSAGKSTLSNLLIGAQPLPMKVTATQLPPVWISWGDGAPYREDIHGDTHPIDMDRLAEIDPAETRVIRIFEKSEVLEHCDIIDMPGISDPNMDSEVWERVIDRADGVIWCTHATQAWRQSEASVWESLSPKLFETSILLVTRFDKILSENDRARVMRRVARETEGLFTARLPISLTRALAAGDDPELLEDCGAAAFVDRFFDILQSLARNLDTTSGAARTRRTLAREGLDMAAAPAPQGAGGIVPGRILPRRVRPVSQPAPGLD